MRNARKEFCFFIFDSQIDREVRTLKSTFTSTLRKKFLLGIEPGKLLLAKAATYIPKLLATAITDKTDPADFFCNKSAVDSMPARHPNDD